MHCFAQRESGTSLTIGAGSGTGRKSSEETQFSFEYSGCEFWITSQDFSFILETFRSRKSFQPFFFGGEGWLALTSPAHNSISK